jgi:membrane protease YdiL (CAAX protease family)
VGLVVGMVVSSVVFMLLHGAGDPWLNAFYLMVGGLFATLAWRSGGLEAAVAMHIANNMIGEMFLPFQPDQVSGMFNRQAGVGDPSILIQMGTVVLVAVLLWWQGSRLGMVRTAAPAAAALDWPPQDASR